MLKALTIATILMWSCSAVAQDADDRVILAHKAKIEAQCGELHARGISCEFISTTDIDRSTPSEHLWVPVDVFDLGAPLDIPHSNLGFLERSTGIQYYAQALIYPRSDSRGQQYYMVRMVVIGHTGSSDPVVSDRHEDSAWQAFDSMLQTAQADSDQTASYFTSIDSQAALETAAKSAADERAQAHATYLNSPEYKRSQLHDAAQSCQKTIVWARRVIAQDERVAAISGYENADTRERAANAIVGCEDTIRAAEIADRLK